MTTDLTRRIHSWTAAVLLLFLLAPAAVASSLDHDLELEPAFDVTATAGSSDVRSPDIKLGADFGDTSVPDIVRRGATVPVYARFHVNGVDDWELSSATTTSPGDVEIQLHYRNATAGETPPPKSDPSWNSIGTLPVSFPPDSLLLTRTWPDPSDFPAVTPRKVDWNVPTTGDLFHVRAEVVYRSDGPDQDPGDNVAISLYESILGVRDVDLVVLHDLSGSMLTFKHEGNTYLEQAKARAKPFVLSMNGNHRLAVVGFGGCLTGDVTDVWDTTPPTLKLATPANKTAAEAAIDALTIPNTGCMTPMGPGLERARQILTSVPADPTRKRTILLLTDGYDNSGSPRACLGTSSPPCAGSTVATQLAADDVRVYSIGLGAAAWTDCLVCLTGETGGEWYAADTPGLDLAQVYLDMQQAYSADDLYRADRGVTGRGTDTYQTHFEGEDDVLYFILQSEELDAEIDLEIRPPGGSWQSAGSLGGASLSKDRGYSVVRVDEPPAGTWGYRVVGEERQEYLVAVRSDRVGVRLHLDVRAEGRAGDPILIRTRLTEGGKPTPAEGLTAQVEIPLRSSLDSLVRREARRLLRQRGRPIRDLLDLDREADVSLKGAFLSHLTDGQLQRAVRTRVVQVPLEPRRDGSFAGVLEEQHTRIAGEYRVTVSHRGDEADREWSKSVHLAPTGLHPRGSFAELVKLRDIAGARQRWLVRVYPTDKHGNAITEPALIEDLRVSVRGARPRKEPKLSFDGALEQVLDIRGNRRPVLERVEVRGRAVRIDQPPR